MSARFDGKVAVVTGAAGGIGRATALRLASEGARIVAVDVNPSELDETLAVVRDAGSEGLPVRADVTDAADVERYVTEATTHFGGVDFLFNNAGIEGAYAPLTEYPEATFRPVLDVNVVGVWLGMKYAGPAMRERGGGSIVNVASTAGLGGTPNLVAYGASKHAVIGMTKTAAVELAPETRVNAICPGGVRNGQDEAFVERLTRLIPMGRMARRDEYRAAVVFLCSDASSYMTGSHLVMDGGRTAW